MPALAPPDRPADVDADTNGVAEGTDDTCSTPAERAEVVASIDVVAAAVENVVVGASVVVDGTSDVEEGLSVVEVGTVFVVFVVSVVAGFVSFALVVGGGCTGGPTPFGGAVVVASA